MRRGEFFKLFSKYVCINYFFVKFRRIKAKGNLFLELLPFSYKRCFVFLYIWSNVFTGQAFDAHIQIYFLFKTHKPFPESLRADTKGFNAEEFKEIS